MKQRNQTPHSFSLPPLEQLLGGLTPEQFFRDYWQKKPLLVRGAVPGLDTLLDGQGLLKLACREDAESRLVRAGRGKWRLDHGPFDPDTLADLPKKNWSVLVQGVNMLLPEGDDLLNRFNFVPYARLDDLMVSFAPPGGGVGPHFDSYDVFLIQGLGRRRWEISTQDDLELVEDAPLRILKRFQVEQSWELEPGDMLYLPPQCAHNGVALTDCMTWSIGFRAPPTQEIATQFLLYLQDTLELDGRFADPDLKYNRHPGEIPNGMIKGLKAMIRRIRWDDADMEDFIGRYLSEPKFQVVFEPPRRPMAIDSFQAKAGAVGIRLDARSRLLYRGGHVYMNGERIELEAQQMASIRQLADRRVLPASPLDEGLLNLYYAWYRDGYLHPGA